MDKLKEYLLRRKADLDVDSPANDTWDSIRPKIADEQDRTGLVTKPAFTTRPGFPTWIVRYVAAASIIALAGAGLWLLMKDNKAPADTAKHNSSTIIRDSGRETIENTIREEEKSPIKDMARSTSIPKRVKQKARSRKPPESSDEIDAIDKNYSSLIDYELRKLRAIPLYAENGSYFSFYVEQFKQMDQDEQQVRSDIKTYGLTGEFLQQLINVYQQKLNVLKDLQMEINKMNNKVMEKEGPSQKAEVHYLNI